MMKNLSLLAVLLLIGCSSPTEHKLAVMHHPETKDVKECKIDPWASWQWEYKKHLQDCIDKYEAIGYERI